MVLNMEVVPLWNMIAELWQDLETKGGFYHHAHFTDDSPWSSDGRKMMKEQDRAGGRGGGTCAVNSLLQLLLSASRGSWRLLNQIQMRSYTFQKESVRCSYSCFLMVLHEFCRAYWIPGGCRECTMSVCSLLSFEWHFFRWSEHSCLVKTSNPCRYEQVREQEGQQRILLHSVLL